MARYSVRTITERLGFSSGMARIVKGLMEGTISPDNFKDVKRWERQCFNRPRKNERVLCALNQLLEGFGVEAIRGGIHVDSYHGSIVASFINMGDTYDTTIILNHDSNEYQITSWGDWVERNEGRYKLGEYYCD